MSSRMRLNLPALSSKSSEMALETRVRWVMSSEASWEGEVFFCTYIKMTNHL